MKELLGEATVSEVCEEVVRHNQVEVTIPDFGQQAEISTNDRARIKSCMHLRHGTKLSSGQVGSTGESLQVMYMATGYLSHEYSSL